MTVKFHENDFSYVEFVEELSKEGEVLPPLLDGTAAARVLASATGGTNWDSFYKRESDPYKPRRYLSAEFPELLVGLPSPAFLALPTWVQRSGAAGVLRTALGCPPPPLLFDVGCGYGSALVPLLKENPSLRAVACDLSPTAVAQLRAGLDTFDAARVRCRPWDITHGLPPEFAAAESERADVAILVFTLSAVDPAAHVRVLRTIKQALKPGSGVLCFRDRAEHDLTMRRSRNQRLGAATFVREDGTLAHYFTVEDLERLAAAAGLEVLEKPRYCTVKLHNRRKGTAMHRCFVHCVLRRPLADDEPGDPAAGRIRAAASVVGDGGGVVGSGGTSLQAASVAASSDAGSAVVQAGPLWAWRLSFAAAGIAVVAALLRPPVAAGDAGARRPLFFPAPSLGAPPAAWFAAAARTLGAGAGR